MEPVGTQPAAAAAHVDEDPDVEATTAASAAEWAVIDDELLARALLPVGQGQGDGGAPADLVEAVTQATTLELSHCRLRQINHLDGFRRLTRLRLDNNGITVMENLESLVHLTWLDLSFNQIERIKGLETLRKLTDLSLYHNRIRDVEGLAQAGCRGLQYLSLGRNCLDLSAPSQLLGLLAKRFPALDALVLQGQQAAEGSAPSADPLAVRVALPCLQYLDHQLLTKPSAGKGNDGAGPGVVGA